MPITTQTPINNYSANGSVTVFAYTYKILVATDLKVYKDGVLQASGYSVSGVGVDGGGSVTFSVAPANGVIVRLQRLVPLDRATDYTEGGQLAASTLDNDFDRIEMQIQDLDAVLIKEASDGAIDAGSRRIKNVTDPTSAQNVATKNYCDTAGTSFVVAAAASATAAHVSELAAAASAAAIASGSQTITNAVITGGTINNTSLGATTRSTVAGTTGNFNAGLTVTGGTLTSRGITDNATATALSIGGSGPNGVLVSSVASGSSPYLIAADLGGSGNASIGLRLIAKGAGSLSLETNAGANVQAVVTHVASAVNYLTLRGAVTADAPVIGVAGSDTNIPFYLTTKGTGATGIYSRDLSSLIAAFVDMGSVNNQYLSFYGDNNNGPRIIATGGNANLYLSSAGTGSIYLYTGALSAAQVRIDHTASANRYITLTGSNGGNPTIGTSAGNLAITPDTYHAGKVGIGAAPAATTALYSILNSTTTAAPEQGSYSVLAAVSASGANNKNGVVGLVQTGAGYTGTGQLNGVYGAFSNAQAGLTISSGVGVYGYGTSAVTGTITNLVGLQGLVANAGGATVSNGYGVYAPNHSVGTLAAGFYTDMVAGAGKWAFLSAGTAASYFGGTISAVGTIAGTGGLATTSTTLAGRTLTVAYDGTYYYELVQQGAGGVAHRAMGGGAAHDFETISTGNIQVRIAHTATANQYVTLTGGVSNGVSISAAGAANPNIYMFSGGSGIVSFGTGSAANEQVRINHTASANRYITLTGSNGGSPRIGSSAGGLDLIAATPSYIFKDPTGSAAPQIFLVQTSGTDRGGIISSSWAGNGLYLDSYGAGGWVYVGSTNAANVAFTPGGVEQVRVTTTASANRYITLTGSNGGNPTIGTSAGSLAISSAVACASGLTTSGTSGMGFVTGSGGTVTQITSRTTGVTINKPTGAITLFTAAGSATPASFTVTNSQIASTDVVILSVKSGTNRYLAMVTSVSAGSFDITFWTTGGTTSDAPVINFAVIKGATA